MFEINHSNQFHRYIFPDFIKFMSYSNEVSTYYHPQEDLPRIHTPREFPGITSPIAVEKGGNILRKFIKIYELQRKYRCNIYNKFKS